MINQQSEPNEFNSFHTSMITSRSFKTRELLKKMLFHWPLFIIFLGVCFAIAIVYIKFSRPLFSVEAKILIKDPATKRNEGAALQQLDLTESPKSVDTEMGLLTSIPNIEQVVNDLQLWITYKTPTIGFTYKDIYGKSPVQFKLIKADAGKPLKSEDLDIFIKDANTFSIKQISDTTRTFSFKDEMVSNFGTWKLDTTKFLKNYIGKTVKIHLQNPKDVVKSYQEKIDAENVIKTNPTITLTMDDEVPERGRSILNDLLQVYTAASIEDKRKSTQSTLQFVNDRLSSLTGELNAVERNYQGYKSSHGITEISAESAKFLNDEAVTDKQLNDVNMQLSVLNGIENYVNSDQGADNPPALIGLNDPGLAGLVKQLADIQLVRTRYLATTPETNPLFTPINQQIRALRSQIKENIKGIRQSLLTTKTQIQSIGSNYNTTIRGIPEQERELVDIKRMQGVKEDLYKFLLQKQEEISLDYASTIADSRIIEQAHYGSQKSPIPQQAYAIAFLFGLLIPAGLIFGRDAIKNRVTSKNEITSGTGIQVLSEFIYEEDPEQIRVLNNNHFIGEQFRDLRTKINYLQGKSGGGKITLLTSGISGEGKSFVASNLAVTLAVSGKKTIVLEMDLRRPKLVEIFKLEKNKPGISDFLHGDATKNQIVRKLSITDNLFVIGCGPTPPNPSELLESNKLTLLLEELRAEYDHILIDTPPVHLVTDAMIIAPLCDVTLYMIRQDYTSRNELEFIKELYVSKKLPRMNIIFNGVQNDKHGYGYSYHNNSYYTQAPRRGKHKIKRFFSRF